MANDITSINSAKAQQSAERATQRVRGDAERASGSESRSDNNSDKVSLTSTAAQLKNIEKQMGSEAPVNQNRVNQMRDAIERGEYSVDAGRVADKMMNFETTLRR